MYCVTVFLPYPICILFHLYRFTNFIGFLLASLFSNVKTATSLMIVIKLLYQYFLLSDVITFFSLILFFYVIVDFFQQYLSYLFQTCYYSNLQYLFYTLEAHQLEPSHQNRCRKLAFYIGYNYTIDVEQSPFKDGPSTNVVIQRYYVITTRHNRCRKVIRTDVKDLFFSSDEILYIYLFTST